MSRKHGKLESSNSNIEIKLLESKDESGLLNFMEEHLGNWKKFHTFWNWRKAGLPHSGGESAVIAKVDGSVVGCVGIVPLGMALNDTPIKACWQQDSLVSSSMRGKGLGKRLVNYGSEGWHVVLAKGTSKPMYGLRKSLGFLDVPHSDYMVKVCKLKMTQNKPWERLAGYALWLWRLVLPLPRISSNIRIERIQVFDENFDTLAQKLSKDHVVRPFKGQAYLNWRYSQCPGKTYTIFRTGGKHVRGAIVLNLTGEHSDEGWIVDLICAPHDKECAYGLLKAAMNYFKQHKASRIWAFATLPLARRWLFRFGLVPSGRTPRFTYRIQDDAILSTTLANVSWDFWHGDGDMELYM